jgi:uncharacterized oxidoreductase
MNLSGNTILITGGASGIGFALAKRFTQAGSQVIVCGRRQEQLDAAMRQVPGLKSLKADVASEKDREALVEHARREFPELNVLINNAGIQNHLPPLTQTQPWAPYRNELAINVEAPIHLSMLLLPHLLTQKNPYLMNVTSGLAFSPLANVPMYCATKSAMHSFTLSLRHQLRATPVKVVEIIPPAVNTDLGGKGLHDFGEPLDAYADHAMACIARGDLEFGYKFSEMGRLASREQLNQTFERMNPK